jgi:hypothetical protein
MAYSELYERRGGAGNKCLLCILAFPSFLFLSFEDGYILVYWFGICLLSCLGGTCSF